MQVSTGEDNYCDLNAGEVGPGEFVPLMKLAGCKLAVLVHSARSDAHPHILVFDPPFYLLSASIIISSVSDQMP